MDFGLSGVSSTENTQQRQKRSRVLLSCAPCRHSKLKCDRGQPCTQCLKKERIDLCTYAPKPEKRRPAKGVAARLKRLEGMVREMMDADGNIVRLPPGMQQQHRPVKDSPTAADKDTRGLSPPVVGNVVQGDNTTTYVGATHCMAMLEDIEDLKEYFDYPDDESEGNSPLDAADETGEMLLVSGNTPKDRDRLLRELPDKQVMGRLITRYFASMSPSQHIVHRPSFTKAYAKFCQDQNAASYHWLAQLFMVLALGTFFNKHQNHHEVDADSLISAEDRIKQYRACAGWALVWGRFTQPTFRTLPAFLLYTESHFLLNRAAQMNCYILSGILMRLMLKMGLHRDPSKLANIPAFEGEMRRRIWNMATQLETIVSFHMGLPSMIAGIESDVSVPHNLHDEDLDEDCEQLPPERPHTDWTVMTYPIHKTRMLRVFDQIGRQAHALQPPSYSEVLRIDTRMNEVYNGLPSYMFVRSLDESVGDPPALLIQRYGLASLYNKSRCVLHRRYLAEPVPKREHDYSRQQGLDGALTLLDIQQTIFEACKPGHILGQNGWFVSSLAVHDYLLAAMVVYLVIQNEHYASEDSEYSWQGKDGVSPTKDELKGLLRRSYNIWCHVATDVAELRKTADTLALMLIRLGCPVDGLPLGVQQKAAKAKASRSGHSSSESPSESSLAPKTDNSGSEMNQFATYGYDSSTSGFDSGPPPYMFAQAVDNMPMGAPHLQPSSDMNDMITMDTTWMTDPNSMDWRYLDISLAHSQTAGLNAEPGAGSTWTERLPQEGLDDVNIMSSYGLWGDQSGGHIANDMAANGGLNQGQ